MKWQHQYCANHIALVWTIQLREANCQLKFQACFEITNSLACKPRCCPNVAPVDLHVNWYTAWLSTSVVIIYLVTTTFSYYTFQTTYHYTSSHINCAPMASSEWLQIRICKQPVCQLVMQQTPCWAAVRVRCVHVYNAECTLCKAMHVIDQAGSWSCLQPKLHISPQAWPGPVGQQISCVW